MPGVLAFSTPRSFAKLKLVAVEMEGVDCDVKVIYYNLHDVAFVDYEWIDGTVDRGNRGVWSIECSE